jgi:DNA-directed RNA polymerase sigma subunit (sigma70/sigma32)
VAHHFEPLAVEDNEEDYRAQIARYPRLSSAEERGLLATSGRARDEANRRLIEHNLHLVYEAARARKERGVPFGDLFQEGTVGLISAVEHYTPADGPFQARLVDAIAATMDGVLEQSEAIHRNDEAFVTACRLLESAQRLLSSRLERPATPAELAKLLQWEEARVNVILEMLSEARGVHDQELVDYLDDLDDLGGTAE